MIKNVNEIPQEIENGSYLEITSTKISYYTHGFFKYPCKFIPQIPRWAINKYSNIGDTILDPFAGSGTTLVEAVLNRRNGLAIDFDKFAQLLCNVKTKIFSTGEINQIKVYSDELFSPVDLNSKFLPDIHNLNHWFPDNNIKDLLSLRINIENNFTTYKNEKIYNFFLVCFASIIRKCSFADDVSPKPYVSSRFKKVPSNVKDSFLKTLKAYLSEMLLFVGSEIGECKILGGDARKLDNIENNYEVNLVITSPPYINAFDYVRSLRLENAWLGFYGDTNIIDVKKMQVGSENVSASVYSHFIYSTKNMEFENKLKQIFSQDRKRAYIVYKYFEDMKDNLKEVFRILKPGGHYIIVVGDSLIRGVHIPTHQYLKDLADEVGFVLDNEFSYKVKNKYLRIPRSGQGGNIDRDWILDLRR